MFLKSLLRNIKSKIGEPVLIVITVALAVATFVSALSLRASIEDRLEASYRSLSGEATLEAVFTEDYLAYYTTEDSAEYRALETAAEPYGTLHGGYVFRASAKGAEEAFARVYATDVSDLMTYNEVTLSKGAMPMSSGGAVVSRSFARKIGADVGSLVEISLYGSARSAAVEIVGISDETGVFLTQDVLVWHTVPSRLLSLPSDVTIHNRFYIEISAEKCLAAGVSESDAADSIEALGFTLSSPVNEEDVALTLMQESTLLFVIAALVAVLGAVLIYTAVTLVMKGRLSLAALFRSVGATSGQIVLYLLMEIVLYGVVGGIAGVLLSHAASALFNGVVSGVASVASVAPWMGVVGVLFGVVLSLISALIPVWKTGRMSLADMLGAETSVVRYGALPAAVSGACFVALFIGAAFSGASNALLVGIFAALFLVAFALTFSPLVVKWVAALVMRLTDRTAHGTLYIAAAGAKENKHVRSGVRLLTVAVILVAAVASLCGEAAGQLSSFETMFRADVMIASQSSDVRLLADSVREESGVEGAYVAYVENKCALPGGSLATLIAVRGQEYGSVIDTGSLGFEAEDVAGSRRVAIGEGLAMKLGISLGDTFAVKVNGEETLFVAAKFIDTPLALLFTDLSGLGVEGNVCLARVESEEIWQNLAEKYSRTASVERIGDVFAYITDVAEAYIKVFLLFDVLVILFALGGYVNNALASYRDRRREFELYRSAGASLSDRRRIIAVENLLVVLCAAAVAAALSVALLFVVQNMLKSFGLYFRLLG